MSMQGIECREFLQRKDKCYVATFEPKDAIEFQKHMLKVNSDGRYGVNPLLKKLDRVYNDQTTDIEPIKVGISGNKLVNTGLVALSEMQVGKRTRLFDYYAIGESEQPVNIRDLSLYEEVSRLRIPSAGGNFIQRQSTIFYSIFFPKTTNDCTVRETGIYDSSSGGKLLLRTVLPTLDNIPHKKNFDTIFVAHIIYSGSV